MNNFFKKPKEKINENLQALKDLDTHLLIYRIMPRLVLEIMRRYFRLEVEGIENIPRRGSALITPNHSGYAGLDAVLLCSEVHKSTGRIPRLLAHQFWFLHPATAVPANKLGFIKANMKNGLHHLQKNNLVVIFPEGEYGNFKPTYKRYHLQTFRRGFVRMALKTQTPIIPTLILGAEETHFNLTRLKLDKLMGGMVLPIPLNVIPLPAKWKIIFLKPIHLPYKPEAADDEELVNELAGEIREEMQEAISNEVQKRGSIYL